jgi:hypothetical protein
MSAPKRKPRAASKRKAPKKKLIDGKKPRMSEYGFYIKPDYYG